MAHINFPDTNQELLSELFSENGGPSPAALEAPLGSGCHHRRGPKNFVAQLYLGSRITTCFM